MPIVKPPRKTPYAKPPREGSDTLMDAKYGAPTTVRLHPDVRAMLREYCEWNGLKVGQFVQEAIEEKLVRLQTR